jgi:putative addiction module component (TIGR02574 family)
MPTTLESPVLESPVLAKLREEILALPSEQRELLIASVYNGVDASFGLSPGWKAEIERRMKRFHAGESELFSEEDVDRELEEIANRP